MTGSAKQSLAANKDWIASALKRLAKTTYFASTQTRRLQRPIFGVREKRSSLRRDSEPTLVSRLVHRELQLKELNKLLLLVDDDLVLSLDVLEAVDGRLEGCDGILQSIDNAPLHG